MLRQLDCAVDAGFIKHFPRFLTKRLKVRGLRPGHGFLASDPILRVLLAVAMLPTFDLGFALMIAPWERP
jgi:hypothetical protein